MKRDEDPQLDAVANLSRPLTAVQLAAKCEEQPCASSKRLRELAEKGLAVCANPAAQRSRVYCLTEKGIALRDQLSIEQQTARFDDVDLTLFGWVCFRHRAAVLLALDEPLQPAAIKRKALRADPTIKMSANNARDVIYRFLEKGIVEPVEVRGKAHLRYQLTSQGRALRTLLQAP